MNRIVLGGLVALALAGLGAFWWQGRAQVERAAPPPEPAKEEPAPEEEDLFIDDKLMVALAQKCGVEDSENLNLTMERAISKINTLSAEKTHFEAQLQEQVAAAQAQAAVLARAQAMNANLLNLFILAVGGTPPAQ